LFQRLVREPFLHFTVLAILIFAGYFLITGSAPSNRESIVVTGARIEQLAGLFAKTWQREPTPTEMKALVDDYVAAEIYYREARKLGLDTDDAVIRQRLRLKMELLDDVSVDQLSPADGELEAFLAANAGKFEIDPQLAFEHVMLSPSKRGPSLEADTTRLLAELRGGGADPAVVGDASLLPPSLPLTDLTLIGREFGDAFSSGIAALPVGEWSGPVNSAYGVHIVRVTDRRPGKSPAIAEVRDDVVRDWKAQKREAARRDRLATLSAQYDIVIEADPADPDRKDPTTR